jgi:hypothetical protein
MGEVVADLDLETLRPQLSRLQVEKVEPVVGIAERQIAGMVGVKRGSRDPEKQRDG